MGPKSSSSDKRRICPLCGRSSRTISGAIGVCLSCIRNDPHQAVLIARKKHEEARRTFGLPERIPKGADGIPCNVCANECRIGIGEVGYCNLKKNIGGKIYSSTKAGRGVFYSYLDPHVTNCCSAWFCPAGTGAGYPKFSPCQGPEVGYFNLAVFFYGCNFDCLFCQNWSHKEASLQSIRGADDLVKQTLKDLRISCWCFFGGSPEPQLPFAIRASEEALSLLKERALRICFEWNGCGHPTLVRKAAELSLKSGGNIKFDLKAFDENLSIALSGVSNRRAFQNFEMIAREFYPLRKGVPLLTATTLLVPGYVDADEVEGIAKFIASLDPSIPYSLLAFHPDYLMDDLPITPVEQALECYRAAKKHLERVNVGNVHLLGSRGMGELEISAE